MPAAPIPIKLLNVQSLRAYGALAVAFYHTGFAFPIGLRRPIGSFGVSIFFLISGFIMAMICDTSPKKFLIRRVARIVPLYWLLTLALFVAGRLLPSLMGGATLGGVSLLKSLFFVPYLAHGSYFPILFLGWSLDYEMYFYVLLAMALLVCQRGAALLASGVMIAVMLTLQGLHPGGAWMFYGHPIVLEFVLGVVCYYGFRGVPEEWIRANSIVLVSGILLAASAMIVTALTRTGPINAIAVGMTSTILVFCTVLLDKGGISLQWPLPILLGDASYVIYLVHPYCEEFLNKIVAGTFPSLGTATALGMLVALVVTVVLSIVLYRMVDNPLHLFFRNLLCRPGRQKTAASAMRTASD